MKVNLTTVSLTLLCSIINHRAQNFITKTIFKLLHYTETGVGLIYVNF